MATARKIPKASVPARKPAAKKPAKKPLAVKAAAKPVTVKAAVKPAAAPVARPAPAPTVIPAAAPKADKPKKPKLVRDSFTIPKTEFAVLQDLKQRAGKSGTTAKKSEILRAGIKALAAMNDAAFAAALGAVPPIKTGRPAKA